jgi:hypothetical protein
MQTSNKPPRSREGRRLWIQEEAERLGIPGWATPRWQKLYGKHR